MGKALLAFSEGRADAAEAQAMMRSHYRTEDASAAGSSRKSDVDSPLTENGEDMARRVSRFYAPMLKELAAKGKLHAFCSPMCRNLQTADPLLTELGIQAEVRQDLKETGGLIAPEEMSGVVAQITELANSGKPQEARELLKTATWAQLGMSGEQIKQRFKWATLEADFPSNESTGAYDVPWHQTGIESEKTAGKRTGRVTAWLNDLSEKLPYDDLVLFISHGGALALIFNQLLALGDSGFSYGWSFILFFPLLCYSIDQNNVLQVRSTIPPCRDSFWGKIPKIPKLTSC